ncbi:MAG: TIM barrel protein [Kiritimatiellae bacterium]|nr:TIM barrel protein [Kiritimatiellia bacterium]
MITIACSSGIRSSKSLEEACRVIAELGFGAVDPLVYEPWHIKPSVLREAPESETRRFARLLRKHGLQCPALNLGWTHNPTQCDEAGHRTNLVTLKAACALAAAVGARVICVSPGRAEDPGDPAAMERLAGRMRAMVELAGESGVTLGIESHAGAIPVYPDKSGELLDRCPGLALTYDPSHYIAERIPLEQTLALLARSCHIHLRNARAGHFQETMAKGGLDTAWMADRILESGYCGAVAIEYIEDCGALKEGYETVDEVIALRDLLVEKGMALKVPAKGRVARLRGFNPPAGRVRPPARR